MRRLGRGAASVLLAIWAATAVLPTAHAAAATPASTASSIIPDHFGLGVAASPDTSGINGWMPQSGVSWDYAYQYLTGGANTGAGWQSWGAQAQFPLSYAQAAARQHYLPVFSYYQLLQSNGPCGGCDEPRKDLAHLNDQSVMASYFADFAMLMLRLGPGTNGGIQGFGGPAIVHVEPDLSGYAMQAALNSGHCFGFCTGQGNDPALLKAAVARTGFAAVAGYPDTYQGFNRALLHLRDLYAPNVKLAFHVSTWAAMRDLGSDTDPTLDATALGTLAGAFAALSGTAGNPAGASTYELIFNDVADHDAGYLATVRGQRSVWWDRRNVSFPNFHRWEDYIRAASRAAGRPAVVWQIPLGNQYFQTENNTPGHYQDNRVEYFLDHVDELKQAGIVGLLFGAGNAGSTVHAGTREGITNPPAICNTDGTSGPAICNDHMSTSSDGDGGYLRMAAQRYYSSGPPRLDTPAAPLAPLALAPPPSPAPAPAAAAAPSSVATLAVTLGDSAAAPSAATKGQTITLRQALTSTVSGAFLVDFELYDAQDHKVWQTWHDAETLTAAVPASSSAPYVVALLAGRYTFKLGVFTPGWGTLYAWNNNAGSLTVSG